MPRTTLGVPHDSLLSARSLTIYARERRGSVFALSGTWYTDGVQHFMQLLPLPCVSMPRASAAHGSQGPLMKTDIMKVLSSPVHAPMVGCSSCSAACMPRPGFVWDRRGPISSKWAYRLATQGWLDLVCCCPLSLQQFALAARRRHPLSGLPWPALKMRYNAVLVDWSCRHAVPVENQLLHTRSRSRLVHPGNNWLAGSLARFHVSNAHLVLAAEHAAVNRCSNRKRTEQIGCRV
jgi:hypothetical protein